MTGFGRGEAPLGQDTLVVEARSVNARFCEVRASWPRRLGLPPGFGEDVVKRRLSRGRVEIGAFLAEGARRESLEQLVERLAPLAELRDRLDPGGPFPWALHAALPSPSEPKPSTDDAEAHAAASAALEAALDALEAMRAREGAALAVELGRIAADVRTQLELARAKAPRSVERARARLRERIAALLEGQNVPLDEGRLELELAILADKSDVTEELARLDAHLAEFDALLQKDEPVGRRLDFLLQEMHREVNTLGSKSADGKLSSVVIELKSLLEKLREQVQNVL